MKKILITYTFIFIAFMAFAQQDAQYSQYMFNGLVINPAFAGSYDAPSAALFHRSQWVGVGQDFQGRTPTSQALSYHQPINYGTSGAGIHVQNDQIGLENKLSAIGSLAYRVSAFKGTISFGMQAGVHSYRIEQPKIKDTDDERFTNMSGAMIPDLGAGAFYKSKKLYIGVSSLRLLESDFKVNTFAESALLAGLSRHYFITSAYKFELSRTFNLVPSFLVKIAEEAPVSTDLNCHLYYNETIWVGSTYRVGDSFSFQAGTKLEKLSKKFKDTIRVGYAFDLTQSDFRAYNRGSHELMLTYDFGKGKPKTLHSPRFRF